MEGQGAKAKGTVRYGSISPFHKCVRWGWGPLGALPTGTLYLIRCATRILGGSPCPSSVVQQQCRSKDLPFPFPFPERSSACRSSSDLVLRLPSVMLSSLLLSSPLLLSVAPSSVAATRSDGRGTVNETQRRPALILPQPDAPFAARVPR